MAQLSPRGWWRRFAALPLESTPKTLLVATLVALASATLVSVTSVLLKPLQQAHLERERQAQIVAVVSRAIGDTGPLTAYVIELSTGQLAPQIDPVTYDQRQAAQQPEMSVAVPAQDDLARIGRRAKYATVFIRRGAGKPELIVLPVHGLGYQSTLYGYLALRGDGNTVAALTFYEQGETPGFGARITDSAWLSLWTGKQIADERGAIRIAVSRGKATSPYEVDGISGATRTGNGITNLLHYWLGDHGFGPFLQRVRSGEF
jgi:Na+-transporting NADH:ubiquinone oxidoreductase subunit C